MKPENIKRIFALVLALIMIIGALASTASVVFGASLDEEIKDKQEQISDAEKKAQEYRAKAKAILDEIADIDKDIADISDRIRQYQENLEETQTLLNAAQEELDQAIADRAKYQKLLEERLAVMYMYGDVGYMEILFSSESLTDLITRINMITSIASYDSDIKAKLDEAEAKIQKKTDEIAEKKAQIEKLISDLNSEKSVLNRKKSDKQSKYDSARSDAALWDAVNQELQEDLKKLYAESGGDYTTTTMGNDLYNLLWPTPGYTYITDTYGSRWHPIDGGWKMHYGLDIGAYENSKIVAPGNGYVSYARYHYSFGNCIKLEIGTFNGDSYQLLFAHANRLVVEEGDYVTRGQVIAYVGSTGDSTGPHLHLEVRRDGERIDPELFF